MLPMSGEATAFKGVMHGKFIELENDPGLPDGPQVQVTVQRAEEPAPATPAPERLARAFGAWSDRADDVDAFLEHLRHERDRDDRAEPAA